MLKYAAIVRSYYLQGSLAKSQSELTQNIFLSSKSIQRRAMEIEEEKLKEYIVEIKEAVLPLIPEDATRLKEWCDDECCTRFLHARDWDLNEATKLLTATLSWRIQNKPDTTDCPLCITNPFAHSLRMIGFDLERRPVLYTCFGQANQRFDVDGNIIHLCKLLEDTSVLMKKMGTKRWVWIIDFEGFGYHDCSIQMMNRVIQLLDHYPSRLGQLVVLDSPWLFSGLWRTVSPLLPAGTKAKITFASLKDIDTKLRAWLGDENADWLKRETVENRNPVISKGKKYWEWLNEDGSVREHDPRGAKSFVEGEYYRLPVLEKFCNSLTLAANQVD